jgi:membrane-associated phospholipid phosphatase
MWLAKILRLPGSITSTRTARDRPATDAELKVAAPWLVAWRTRQLLAFLLVLGLALVGLTMVASQANPNGIDVGATRWLQQVQNPAFAALMVWVSWPGFAPQTWVMPFLVAAPFAMRRLWVEALWILGTQLSSLLVVIFKDAVNRARPSSELVDVIAPLNSPSFPSGHVVQYSMLFGFAFFLVYVLAQRSRFRSIGLVLLAVPVVLVGLSRLYLGQHWLSDVLGGYAVAAILLLPMCWAYTRWRLDRARSPAHIQETPHADVAPKVAGVSVDE